jgi:uncharacterized protein (DUF305 family)
VNKFARRFAILLILTSAPAAATLQEGGHSHADKANVAADWSALMGSMAKMHAATAQLAPSGDSDVDFVELMLPHHEAAIDMAKTELLYGKDPQMRRLAQEIVTDQQSETQFMQLWMKQHEAGSQK